MWDCPKGTTLDELYSHWIENILAASSWRSCLGPVLNILEIFPCEQGVLVKKYIFLNEFAGNCPLKVTSIGSALIDDFVFLNEGSGIAKMHGAASPAHSVLPHLYPAVPSFTLACKHFFSWSDSEQQPVLLGHEYKLSGDVQTDRSQIHISM